MSDTGDKREVGAVSGQPGKPKRSTKLRQVMIRIPPELYSALEVIAVGRCESGSDGRKNSVSYLVGEILEKHKDEILKEAEPHYRASLVLSKLARLPNGLPTRKRQNKRVRGIVRG